MSGGGGTFTAQYHGFCADCGEEVKGTEVLYNTRGELVHARCPELLGDVIGEPCPRCFCIHAGEC